MLAVSKSRRRNTLEFLKLTFYLCWSARKQVIVALSGLILAMTVISQMVLVTNTLQASSFPYYLERNAPEHMQVGISDLNLTDGASQNMRLTPLKRLTTTTSLLQQVKEEAISVEETAEVDDIVDYFAWRLKHDIFFQVVEAPNADSTLWPDSYIPSTLLGIDEMDAFEPLLDRGQLPQNGNEALLVVSRLVNSQLDLGMNQSRTHVFPDFETGQQMPWVQETQTVITVTGIIPMDELGEITLPNGHIIDSSRMLGNISEVAILTRTDIAMDLIKEAPVNRGIVEFSSTVIFDPFAFDARNIKDEIVRLNHFTQHLVDAIQLASMSTVTIDAPIIDALQAFQTEFQEVEMLVVLYSIPSSLLALFLSMYSMGLVREDRRKWMFRLKARGISRKQIVGFLLLESVLYTFVSIIPAVLLSLPLASFLLTSSGFSAFDDATIDLVVTAPIIAQVLLMQLLIGIAFGFLINWGTIHSLSSMKMEDDEAHDVSAKDNPFWFKTGSDFVLTGIGFVVYRLLNGGIGPLNVDANVSLFKQLTVPALFLLVVGVILLAARIFPIIAETMSRLLWSGGACLSSLSLKSLTSHKGSTARIFILVVFTLSMSLAVQISADTQQTNDFRTAHYEVGADIAIRDVAVYDGELLDAVRSMQGVAAATPIGYYERSQTIGDQLTEWFMLVGIDLDTFDDVAYFDPSFAHDSSLTELVTQMREFEATQTHFPMLVYDRSLDVLQKTTDGIGGSSSHTFENDYSERAGTYTCYFVDSFSSFPRLVLPNSFSDSPATLDILGVVSLQHLVNFESQHVPFYGDIYVKVEEGYSHSELGALLQRRFGHEVEVAADLQETHSSNFAAKAQYVCLNTLYFVSLLVAVSALGMRTSLDLRRRSGELGIVKALGMSRWQLMLLLMVESIVLIAAATFAGVVVGMEFGLRFAMTLSTGINYPPFVLVVNFGGLHFVQALFAAGGMLGTFFPAWCATRREVVEIMEME